MKKIGLALISTTSFLVIWLGMPAVVEPSGRSPSWIAEGRIVDAIVIKSAQAETAPQTAAQSAATTSATSAPVQSDPDACLPRSALDDITAKRKALEKREAEMAAREGELATREKALQEELKKLQALRVEVDKLQSTKSGDSDEKVIRTVEVLESMNPKAASQLVATYDERLAVHVMARMATPKLSKILNVMETKKSARLMELMAGTGTPGVAADGSVPNNNAVKK